MEERNTSGVNLDPKKHAKYREGKARAAFQLVKRLSRLPLREKKKIVLSQILPILTYGCELHHKPTSRDSADAAEYPRWVVGVWRGRRRDRVAGIGGISELEELMQRKRVGGQRAY